MRVIDLLNKIANNENVPKRADLLNILQNGSDDNE